MMYSDFHKIVQKPILFRIISSTVGVYRPNFFKILFFENDLYLSVFYKRRIIQIHTQFVQKLCRSSIILHPPFNIIFIILLYHIFFSYRQNLKRTYVTQFWKTTSFQPIYTIIDIHYYYILSKLYLKSNRYTNWRTGHWQIVQEIYYIY